VLIGMKWQIAENALRNLEVSLRLWRSVDFRSTFIYAEPVQVKSPYIWIPPS